MIYSTTHLRTTGVIHCHQPPSPKAQRMSNLKAPGEQINDNDQTSSDKDKRVQKQALCRRPGMSDSCCNQHDLSVLQPAEILTACKKATPPLPVSKHIKLSRRWIKARRPHQKGWREMANGFIYQPSRAHKSSIPRGWQVFSSSFKRGPMWHAARLNRIISMREDTVR